MNWILLLLAGLFEVCWAVGLKYSNGFTRLGPSIFTIATMTVSVLLLAMSVKTLPLGTAYAIWTGIGAVGAVLCGILLFGDSVTIPRIACVLLILSGIIGLKLLTP
jgi:quaternary ammonium compound-resistance protein SugE